MSISQTTLQQTRTLPDGGSRRRARQGLAIFFLVVVLLSAPIETGIILTDALAGPSGLLWIAPLMFVPTVASVIARLSLREGFSDVSFRVGGRRGRLTILKALALPAIMGLVIYGIAWATGLVGFTVPALGPWIAMIAVLLVLNPILASGEEIGWRGYMLTRLIDSGTPRPLLASGVIWGLWHTPLFLWGGFIQDTPSALVTTVLLMIMAPAMGYMLAWMRLDTGSVWPAVALHASWNLLIQSVFDLMTTGAGRALWIGEGGIITTVVVVVTAVAYGRRRARRLGGER